MVFFLCTTCFLTNRIAGRLACLLGGPDVLKSRIAGWLACLLGVPDFVFFFEKADWHQIYWQVILSIAGRILHQNCPIKRCYTIGVG